MTRKSGILLHPSSLPGPYGIGEIGSGALRFLDFMESSGQQLWQILPLGPTGYGNSPYSALSSFAGNPMLIAIGDLLELGYITKGDLPSKELTSPSLDWIRVDDLSSWKTQLLDKAAGTFLKGTKEKRYLKKFVEEHPWVEDFSLYFALRGHFNLLGAREGVSDVSWNVYWPEALKARDADALASWRDKLSREVQKAQVLQYFFFTQWKRTRKMAEERNIQIIGDIPIFVSRDSADLWAGKENFLLDDEYNPRVVAGVPPDYFSATGQLWGNPLYDWKHLKQTGYAWWMNRIGELLKLVDIIRIDHFRAFDSYWEIPADAESAVDGTWVKGPGDHFFEAVRNQYPGTEILAEDLGMIHQSVRDLRDRLKLPGMNVLQFAFERGSNGRLNPHNSFLPHNHRTRSVVYTGTHDNNTTRGWFDALPAEEKSLVQSYLGRTDDEMAWTLIRAAFMSTAEYTVIPLQDVLNLPSEARMNTPGTVGDHNWSWRVRGEALNNLVASRLYDFSAIYGRLPQDA